MRGRGACMVGVCSGGCAWQGVCVAGWPAWQGMCVAGGGGMHGRGHAWQERRALQQTVRILLECILVGINLSF